MTLRIVNLLRNCLNNKFLFKTTEYLKDMKVTLHNSLKGNAFTEKVMSIKVIIYRTRMFKTTRGHQNNKLKSI